MYAAVDMQEIPARSHSPATGALVGAAIGAVVGVACLAAASVAPSILFSATSVAPASVSTIPAVPSSMRYRSASTPIYASVQRSGVEGSVYEQTTQTTPSYTVAFGLFATVAGALNGLFLWNKRTVMAATTGRREALMAGAAAAGFAAGPAFAAYGEGANVFGKPKDSEQYSAVQGDGWSLQIPSKYIKSKERDFPGTVARWEDNFDAVNNTTVIVRDAGKNSVTEFGDLDSVRNSLVTPLLGQQAYEGPSISEGGFAPGRYAAAAVLDQKEETVDGKVYYRYEILTRSADGNEGGRHQLFSVVASNGKLVILKSQAGDKRWFKGLEKPIRASISSFRVA